MTSSTSSSSFSSRQTFNILLGTLLISLFYMAVTSLFGLKARFAESNQQTNLIRLSDFQAHSDMRLILCGSSLTGRLLPDYFASTGLPVDKIVNLGLDGMAVPYSVEQVAKSDKPIKLVVIEGNLILKRNRANEKSVEETLHSLSFRLTRKIPLLSPAYRPSSELYSLLKQLKEKEGNSAFLKQAETFAIKVQLPQKTHHTERDLGELPLLSAQQLENARAVAQMISTLQEKGRQVMVVMLPMGKNRKKTVASQYAYIHWLMQNRGIAFLDLMSHMPDRMLRYSDGMHMQRSSAKLAVHYIAQAAKELEAQR